MPTLTYLENSFDCTTAIKGNDYIRLLDENGILIASFEGIADFSAFTLTNGEYTTPTAENQCYVAVIRDDGTIAKGGHRCSDISGHNHDDRYYTESEVDTKLAGKAASSHNHSAGEITSGTLAVARGGTGLTASPSMLTNLGSTTAASVLAASPRPGVTGTLPVANGGTGATDAATARSNLGVTLANLGAAAASHNHSAANITSGTLAVARGGTGVTSLDELLAALGAQPKFITGTYSGNGSSSNRTINIGASGFLLLLHREDLSAGTWYFITPFNYMQAYNGSVSATANMTCFKDGSLILVGSESMTFNNSNLTYRYHVIC